MQKDEVAVRPGDEQATAGQIRVEEFSPLAGGHTLGTLRLRPGLHDLESRARWSTPSGYSAFVGKVRDEVVQVVQSALGLIYGRPSVAFDALDTDPHVASWASVLAFVQKCDELFVDVTRLAGSGCSGSAA